MCYTKYEVKIRRFAMTAPTRPSAHSLPRKEISYRFSIFRVLLFSACMAVLIAFELYCHHTVFASFIEHLATTGKKNSAWIGKQLSFALPFLTVAFFQFLAYRRHEREDGVFQKEKAWEIVCLLFFVYAVLLPVVRHLSQTAWETLAESGARLPVTAGGANKTLLLLLAEWFIRLSIPFALLLVYHALRSARESHDAREANQPQEDEEL